MARIGLFLAGLGLGLVLFAHGAWAAKGAGGAVEPRPVFQRDGRFGFCLADRKYADGRKLTIARSPKGEINIGVSIPDAGFSAGGRYDLDFWIDDATPRGVRAAAMDETTLLLQMGGNPVFLKELRGGRVVHVAAAGNEQKFDLPAMEKLMVAFDACQARYKDVVDEVEREIEEGLPEPLKALLVTSGFETIVPIDMKDVPAAERPADFMWRMGKDGVVGGVRERKAPEGKGMTDLIGLHVKGLKKQCEGRFKAEIGREIEGLAIKSRPAEILCEAKGAVRDGDVFVAILFYMARGDRFTVFSFEAPVKAKASALQARDRLAKTLRELGEKK